MSDERLFTRPEMLGSTGVRPERDPGSFRARRNVYLPADSVPVDAVDRYLLRVRAAHRTLTGEHVFSHESALALLGLPSLHRWPEVVHLVCERRSGGRSQLDVVRHCIGLEHVTPVTVEGMLVTSPGRTAFDIALSRSFAEAVVVADAAFRLYPESRAEFGTLVDAYGRRRGFQRAQAVLRFADPRSGSAGESLSRVEMDRLGFVAPDLQVRVVTGDVEDFADFGWRAVRALGEFDGEVKYREDRYRRGGSVEDVVIREKTRENRMRRQYASFARWDWWDLRGRRLEGILVRAGVPKRRDAVTRPDVTQYSSPARGR
ncbi:hypothetical protein [Amnibacterium setariae]|uniref:AbiEi antitoxin C-terminal domain-containing protein n=1 Tax=Amnibacterium setariae TaxID=2306585 RepID=A0A3A1U5N7_9MICO|nr:hypothetical protein [Amnibacterium setariae]RIX30328.1 hypothetical protein D1781_02515 [Amnibacterium setariae]